MHVTAGTAETLDYRRSPLPVRDELVAAHQRAWARLAAPGEWWTGAVRVAIAKETRAATDCALCKDRMAALSPYAVTGTHTAATELAAYADAFFRDVSEFAAARGHLQCEIGEEASVDAAAVIAIFNAVVRIADATGIPLEEAKARMSVDIRAALGLEGA